MNKEKISKFLKKSNMALDGALKKVKRQAIRVAPYLALAVPGGLALSSYFMAYNKLLDSQAYQAQADVLATQMQNVKDFMQDTMPFLGAKTTEAQDAANQAIIDKWGILTDERLIELFGDKGAAALNQTDEIVLNNAKQETVHALGFSSFPELLNAIVDDKTGVLQTTAQDYYSSALMDNMGYQVNTLPDSSYMLESNNQLSELLEQTAQSSDQKDLAIVAGTLLLGATALVAPTVIKKFKSKFIEKELTEQLSEQNDFVDITEQTESKSVKQEELTR